MARLRKNEKALRPVRANEGLRVEYHRRLKALTDAMMRSYFYWLRAQYRATPPRLAQDATPAAELQREIAGLGARWEKQFDEAAPRLARWFAQSTERRSSAALRKILKDGGFTVRFQMTPTMRDVFKATVSQNVSLIKSIPEHFHTQVEGLVMRSVQSGRDLGSLTKGLQEQFGVTRRRAAFISLDQSNKATSAFNRVRQLEVGGDEAEATWHHSHAGKVPRPTHVANDGKRFKISTGWRDPALNRFIQPGEEPGCRCFSRLVVKGFS